MNNTKKITPLGSTVNDKNETIAYGWDTDKMVYFMPNLKYNGKWNPLHKAINEEEAECIAKAFS